MRIFKSILLGGMLLLSSSAALAQVSLSQNSSGSNVFSLVGKKDKACVYYDAKDFEVVKTTAGLFANDVDSFWALLLPKKRLKRTVLSSAPWVIMSGSTR